VVRKYRITVEEENEMRYKSRKQMVKYCYCRKQIKTVRKELEKEERKTI